jgi:hypothetical protein
LDDDNLMHPGLIDALASAEMHRPDALAVVFGQQHPTVACCATPTLPPVPGRIDGGQVALWRDYATREPWRPGSDGDGQYLAALYALEPARWAVVPDILTYHNAQRWQ